MNFLCWMIYEDCNNALNTTSYDLRANDKISMNSLDLVKKNNRAQWYKYCVLKIAKRSKKYAQMLVALGSLEGIR